MVRAAALLILGLFGSALAVASPQFDQGAELRKSECDNGCFDASFPGGSCTNDPACMCTQKKYREAYFCCMAKKCEADVMPESVERQHTGCQARNLDFAFDAEKVCGIKSATTSVSTISTATGYATITSHGSSAASSSASTTADVETTSSTKGADSASSTAQESSTGGAAPVIDSAPRLGASIGVLSMLFMVVRIVL